MKKVLTVASLLALVALPAWAGGIGVTYSTWDTDEASDDQGGGIKIEIDAGKFVDLEVRTAWLESLLFSGQGEQFKLEAVPIDIGLAYDFEAGGKVQPFVGGGLSYVLLNAKVESLAPIEADDEAGYYVVAGLEGDISERWALFAEVLYRDVSAVIKSSGFLNRDFNDFAVDLGGVGGNVGLMFTW